MPDNEENFCAECERDCSAPQCNYCHKGSQQLVTTVNISFTPTFTAKRIVLRGSEDELPFNPNAND